MHQWAHLRGYLVTTQDTADGVRYNLWGPARGNAGARASGACRRRGVPRLRLTSCAFIGMRTRPALGHLRAARPVSQRTRSRYGYMSFDATNATERYRKALRVHTRRGFKTGRRETTIGYVELASSGRGVRRGRGSARCGRIA